MENKISVSQQQGLPAGKLVHLAISVRWSPVAQEGRGPIETACTYDIHPRGARLLGSGEVRVGDLILVERGRSKTVCRVVWAADRNSPLRGQFTVQCVEPGRTPWDDELRQLDEEYQPAISEELKKFPVASSGARKGDANRRRRPRFYAEGRANVIDGAQRVEGEIQQLSEIGARIAGARKELPRPGTDFRLLLNILDVSLAVKAKVRYLVGDRGMGVEFCEIRRGDRPLLGYVLGQLKTRKIEDVARIEIAGTEIVPAEKLLAATPG
jgi:PilZ domain